MGKPLRVLIVEDSEDDALLLLLELRKGGYDPVFERVETPEAMRSALKEKTWDMVVSDHFMPRLSAPTALSILRDSQLDLPFILMSGAIGEEAIVAAMKAGAHDYIKKGDLLRLLPAMERELGEAEARQTNRHAEAEERRLHLELEQREQEVTALNKLFREQITQRALVASEYSEVLDQMGKLAEATGLLIHRAKTLANLQQHVPFFE